MNVLHAKQDILGVKANHSVWLLAHMDNIGIILPHIVNLVTFQIARFALHKYRIII